MRLPGALGSVGYDNEQQLAAAIRSGALDNRSDDVTACLRTLVLHRLGIANPGYDRR